MKITQTKKELLAHLNNQIRFLADSANSYDKGFEAEAFRLAVAIRILVHDTSESKSLLTQLDKKNILFYDTAWDFNPDNIAPYLGLVALKIGGVNIGEYSAHLDDLSEERLNKKLLFDAWWTKIIIKDTKHILFTRKNLVLNVANKDGGAHIDPNIDKEYAELSRFDSMNWKRVVEGIEHPFKNRPELASIRQITHEVLKTLKDEFPEYF